jgi:hypothetical protein
LCRRSGLLLQALRISGRLTGNRASSGSISSTSASNFVAASFSRSAGLTFSHTPRGPAQ